jgi:sugar phosphate isomerase/epimerase
VQGLPLLSFSTLGCPDWSLIKIVDFAATNGYDGIEIRGIQRELDLTRCPAFDSEGHRKVSRRLVEDKGLRIVDLGSSAELHHPGGAERRKNLDEAKRFIDLAQQLGSPYIRVFPNLLPKDQDRNVTMELMAKGLTELGSYASGSGVGILLESHGDLSATGDIERVMQAAVHPQVGMVWDIVNMWSVTREGPAQVYERLKPYIRHTHIKDLRFMDGKERYTLLGKGEAPVFEGIDALFKGGYTGYYSFEWEKLWHPEIEEPEVALGDYPKVIKGHFSK